MGLLDWRSLLDAANRGAVGGLLGAPVDVSTQALNLGIAGAGYLGHKTGVLDQPLPLIGNLPGGSEWWGDRMQEARLVSPERNPMAEAGAGLLGGLLTGGAYGQAPRVARGLLQAAKNAAVRPSKIDLQRGAIRVRFVEDKSEYGAKASVGDDGVVSIRKMSGGFNDYHNFADIARQAARDRFGTKYDSYFRFTNNKDELALARAGQLRNSRNHAQGFSEPGLSVADGAHYGINGYKYGYRVRGKELDVLGSDGETLLDPRSLEPIGRTQTARAIMDADRRLQQSILKKNGLPPDYFDDRVNFLNDKDSFMPRADIQQAKMAAADIYGRATPGAMGAAGLGAATGLWLLNRNRVAE